MWRLSPTKIGRWVVAGVVLSATTSAQACLFPCLWGWGGYYAPPPMYGAPVYGAPVYAPSPCGPGGCSTYYAPQACCAPCGIGCAPCGSACSPCGPGGCPGGNCGVNYGADMSPKPDNGPTKARTYTEPDDQKPNSATGGMPDDDFEPVKRGSGGAAGSADGPDPFVPPSTPAGSGGTQPPPTPMDEEVLPGANPVHISPLRSRTIARAQYRVPRVARLQVAPETKWFPASEGRIARR